MPALRGVKTKKREKMIVRHRPKPSCGESFIFYKKILGIAVFTAMIFYLVAPELKVADGSGANTVSPTTAVASSAGNTFTFTFTAAETMDSGGISINVPSGWSTPQGSSGTVGYTTVASTGITADVKNNADSTSGWTVASGKCNNGFSADTTVFKEGTALLLCQNSATGNGNAFYRKKSNRDWKQNKPILTFCRKSRKIK